MPPLSVDLPKNYMSPCLPLYFVRDFEFELMESSAHHFDVPLADEGVNVVSGPPLEDCGGQNFRLCERDDVLQGVVQDFGAHEVLQIRDDRRHGVVDVLLELEDLPHFELESESLPLFELGPLASEPLRDFGPQKPFLQIPLLLDDRQHVLGLARAGLFHVPVVSRELPGIQELLLPHFDEVVQAILHVLILDIHLGGGDGVCPLFVLAAHD